MYTHVHVCTCIFGVAYVAYTYMYMYLWQLVHSDGLIVVGLAVQRITQQCIHVCMVQLM